MAFYTTEELDIIGFKKLGKNVKISNKASIYNPEFIEIGDNSRIDDFCILSGKIAIGRNVHISPASIINGGKLGIIFADFSTIAYRVLIFTQTDDYTGDTLSNVTIPNKYRSHIEASVIIEKHAIVGANSTIFPGVVLREGTAIGAMSLVLKSTQPWSIYAGVPVKLLKLRSKNIINLEKQYIEENNND